MRIIKKGMLIVALVLLAGFTFQERQKIGDWTYVPKIDEMTDENTSYIHTNDLNSTVIRDGNLVFRTNGDSLAIYLSAGTYLDNDPVRVICRFDQEEAFPEIKWNPSTDGDAVFCPSYMSRIIVSNAKKYSQVIIRVFDYEGTAYTYKFSLSGFTRAFNLLPCAKYYQ